MNVTSSSASNTSTFGDAVTFTVTVSGTSPPTPTGTVSFSYTNSLPIHANHVFKPVCTESATANDVVTLDATGKASCTPTVAIDAGTDSVTAAYSGDATYAAGSGNVAQTVNTRPTSGSLAGPGTNTQYGQPASFTDTITVPSDGKTQAATVTPPAGTVTVSQGATKLCGGSVQTPAGGATAATCSTHLLPVGTDSGITANYPGNSNYSSSGPSNAVSQTVVRALTGLGLASSANPVVVGQRVTYTATVMPNFEGAMAPTGTVAFADNGQPIASCTAQPVGAGKTATCGVTYASVGNHSISATYSGDGNYVGSSAAQAFSQAVQLGGYWMVGSDGGVFAFGPSAKFYGSMGAQRLNAPIVGMAQDPATGGYWLVASDGGVFAFNAPFYGSMGGTRLNKPVVGIASTPAGDGYWLVASDGGVFSFGPGAHFFGSTGAIRLNKPVVGIAAAPAGNGYWLVASDGGIFTFGPRATFFGSTGSTRLNKPVVGIAATPSGDGYWLVASDGGIFTFGPRATFYGSTGSTRLNQPVVGIAAAPAGNGYWLVASDGGIFTFGPGATFFGSMGATHLNGPIVGMAAAG